MIDDTHLDEVLASIGPLLVLEPLPAAAVTPEIARPPRRWRRWLAGGAAAAVLTIAGVSPLRSAVADWLGIGSTHVEVRPDPDVVPADLPGITDEAMPISPRQPGLDRAGGAPQHDGHLVLGHLLEVTQRDHQPIALGEPVDRGEHHLALLGGHGALGGIGHRVGGGPTGLPDLQRRPPAACPAIVPRRVGDDVEVPAPERAIGVDGAASPPGPQVGILHRIVRAGRRTEHHTRHPERARPMASEQLAERRGVALDGTPHQGVVQVLDQHLSLAAGSR